MEQPRRNIELKAHDPDPVHSLEVCRTLGAGDHDEIWQRDTYFQVANGGLKLREERPGRPHLIQFQRANEPQQRESRYRSCGRELLEGVVKRQLLRRGTSRASSFFEARPWAN